MTDIDYMEVPGHPGCKKGIFEPDDDNCFFDSGNISYLCSYDAAAGIDIRSLEGGFAVTVYERLLIVRNGEVVYRNPSPRGRMPDRIRPDAPPFSDYNTGNINIFSETENEYIVKSWGHPLKTHHICSEKDALHPLAYADAAQAERAVLKLSRKTGGTYITARNVRSADRYLGH